MPLPSDERILELSRKFIQQFDEMFGVHPGFRPAHAKGVLLSGIFTPAPEAASLTKAFHIQNPSTPVSVRFSNSTGLPLLPDNDPKADPRGCAVRFHLAEHVHTDIVAHAANGFPVRTGEEFLEFLKAAVASESATTSPKPIEVFLGSHPSALRFIQLPKPAPVSFATEEFFGVTAMRFINASGASQYGRYRIIPEAGVAHLNEADTKSKDENYLFNEITERIVKNPVVMNVQVQLAEPGDIADDATQIWPEDRRLLPFGKITLKEPVNEQIAEQKKIIFDPIPRVEGIEPSGDPLLELRAAVYLISGRRRRQA